jgi:hypothetical protein
MPGLVPGIAFLGGNLSGIGVFGAKGTSERPDLPGNGR